MSDTCGHLIYSINFLAGQQRENLSSLTPSRPRSFITHVGLRTMLMKRKLIYRAWLISFRCLDFALNEYGEKNQTLQHFNSSLSVCLRLFFFVSYGFRKPEINACTDWLIDSLIDILNIQLRLLEGVFQRGQCPGTRNNCRLVKTANVDDFQLNVYDIVHSILTRILEASIAKSYTQVISYKFTNWYPGELSLDIPPWVGAMSTSETV